MSETPWVRQRTEWVRHVSDADLLRVIASVAARSPLDENLGDATERAETVQWLATRGQEGKDWGGPASAAEDLGLWAEGGGE